MGFDVYICVYSKVCLAVWLRRFCLDCESVCKGRLAVGVGQLVGGASRAGLGQFCEAIKSLVGGVGPVETRGAKRTYNWSGCMFRDPWEAAVGRRCSQR